MRVTRCDGTWSFASTIILGQLSLRPLAKIWFGKLFNIGAFTYSHFATEARGLSSASLCFGQRMWLYGWGCLFDLTACAKNLCAIVVVGIIVCTEARKPLNFSADVQTRFLQTRSRHEAEVARSQQTNMECFPDLLGCKIGRNENKMKKAVESSYSIIAETPAVCQYMYSDPNTQAAGMCLAIASLTQSLPRNLQVSFHSDSYLVSEKKKKKKKKKDYCHRSKNDRLWICAWRFYWGRGGAIAHDPASQPARWRRPYNQVYFVTVTWALRESPHLPVVEESSCDTPVTMFHRFPLYLFVSRQSRSCSCDLQKRNVTVWLAPSAQFQDQGVVPTGPWLRLLRGARANYQWLT